LILSLRNGQTFAVSPILNIDLYNNVSPYTNTKYNFQVNLPNGWIIRELTENEIHFFVEDKNNQSHRLKLKIKPPRFATLEDAVKDVIDEAQTFVNDFKLVTISPLIISGVPATSIVYTGVGVPLNIGDTIGMGNVIVILGSNHMYKFSYEDDPISFKENLQNIKKIVESFKFLS